MTWEQIWANIQDGNMFHPAFRQWIQGEYDVSDMTPEDLPVFSQALGAAYQRWLANPIKTLTDASGQAFYLKPEFNSLGDPVKDDSGFQVYATVPFDAPAGQFNVSQWVYQRADGSQYVAGQPTGEGDAPVGYVDKQGVPQSLDDLFLPQEGEREGLSPSEQLAREQFEYGKSQDAASAALAREKWEADQQQKATAQQNDIWAARQGYEDAYNKQLVRDDAFNSQNREPNTAFNFLNYWKGTQPKPLSTKQRQDVLRARLTPEEIQSAWLANNPGEKWGAAGRTVWDPTQGGYRPVTEDEFSRGATNTVIRGAVQGEGVPGGNAESQWLNINSPWFVPNTREEYDRKVQLEAWGLPQGEGQLGSNWTEDQRSLLQGEIPRVINQNALAPGPDVPDYLKGVLQGGGYKWQPGRNAGVRTSDSSVWGKERNVVNLKTLGREGNVVRPVSAQTYQNWMPSQQEGYAGLVGAQKGANAGDYMDNLGKMWSSSRRGQLAVRR